MLHFCPECRNADVEKPVTGTTSGTARATCPDCETTFEFPSRPLLTLEGAPSAGKSTTAGRLQNELELAVYEGDAHIDLTNGKLSWEAICDLDLRICLTLHAAGKQSLFVGGVYPHTLTDSPETRYFSRIERCALVCSDAALRQRLEAREMDEETIEHFLSVNRWYRTEGPAKGIEIIDTSVNGPDEVARQVTAWVSDARNTAE